MPRRDGREFEGESLAQIQPATTLADYTPKTRSLPLWLDFLLYGPPVVRDSSPGVMAYIFGRTAHDTEWNKNKKGPVLRGFNMFVLACAYVIFLYLPYHAITVTGVLQKGLEAPACRPRSLPSFLERCAPGCEADGLFGCRLENSR